MTHRNDISRAIGHRIRLARHARGLTPAALAAAISVDATTVYRLEAGQTCPRVETLWALRTALACSADDLLPAIHPDESVAHMQDSGRTDALESDT